MSKTQLVTFTPTDAFFFGGETTFGSGDSRNFYAASNAFPQQTTLVGVLRHALFEAGHPNNIGNSFTVNGTANFGFLQEISPVFIYHRPTGNFAIPVSLPYSEKVEKIIPTTVGNLDNMQVNFGKTWQPAPVLTDYKEKHGMHSKLLFSGGDASLKDFDEVFEEMTKTGIARDRKAHTTEKGMFYQQTLFKLKAGYAFGAFVTGTSELFTAIQGRNMPMGGEKKNFVLQTKEVQQSLTTLFYDRVEAHCIHTNHSWVLLTSDAYVSPDIYDHCHLAISETKPFRNIITPDSQYYSAALAKKKDGKVRYKSKQFTLLKRGTILFPTTNSLSNLTNALDDANFKTIGYNHYFTNPKTV